MWRNRPRDVEIAVIHRNKYDDWSLPKGKLDPGEPAVTGALREVWEETGVEATLGPRLATVRYTVRGRPKSVEYWALRGSSGTFQATDEVDRLLWLPLDEARRLVSYARDAELLDVLERIAVPVDGVILLVRHAWAGDSGTWSGDDRLRPLDAEGRRQAQELRRVLPLFGPTHVVAADRARCVETVAPLAEDLGVQVEIEPTLSDEYYARSPDESLSSIRRLALRGQTIAVSAQRSLIPGAVRDLSARHGLAPAPDISAEKGSVWALFFSNGRLLAADYYDDLDAWRTLARKGKAPSIGRRPAGKP